MSDKTSLAGKRKRAAMRRGQPNAMRSSIKLAAVSQPRVKGILVIDVGGTSVKILATGQTESRSFRSGPKLTPRQMVSKVKKLAADWPYDAISIGYPGPVLALQLLFMQVSESMGNHDSKIVDAASVD